MEVLPDRCVPIAKRELLYMGTVGLACWLGGIIFINRQKTDDAISVMAEAARTMLREDVSPPGGQGVGAGRESWVGSWGWDMGSWRGVGWDRGEWEGGHREAWG